MARLAVIGAGSIGTRHADNLRALGHIVTVYDVVPSPGVRVLPAAELPDVEDAWVIATPYTSHLSYAAIASERQIPFFVEKPLGPVEEAAAWRRLARRTRVYSQVGYMLRFHPIAREAYRRAAWGSFELDTTMSEWPGTTYGDPVLECSHELDLLLWLESRHAHDPILFASRCETSASFSGYAHGTAVLCWDIGWSRRRWYFPSWGGHGQPMTAYVTVENDLYLEEMRHFVQRAITLCPGSDAPAATLDDGIRVLDAVAHARHHSGPPRVDPVSAEGHPRPPRGAGDPSRGGAGSDDPERLGHRDRGPDGGRA